jgi:hypothetical protein
LDPEADQEYEQNIQKIIQRCDQVTDNLQAEKETEMQNIIEEYTTEWIERKMQIKADYDFIFKKLDPVKHEAKIVKIKAKMQKESDEAKAEIEFKKKAKLAEMNQTFDSKRKAAQSTDMGLMEAASKLKRGSSRTGVNRTQTNIFTP